MDLPFKHLMLLLLLAAGKQTCLPAQSNARIDSLTRELRRTDLHDSIQVMTRLELAVEYENTDTLQSFRQYRKAIDQSKEKQLYLELGIIYQNLSFLYTALGRYNAVQEVLDSALLYLDKTDHPGRSRIRALVYQSMGRNYERLNDLQQSAEANHEALALFEQNGAQTDAINTLLNLSTLYREMLDDNNEEENIRRALAIARTTRSPSDFFKSYSYLALCLLAQNRTEEATRYIDSAKRYLSPNEPRVFLTAFHLAAGAVFTKLQQLDSAGAHYRQSHALAGKTGDLFGLRQSQLQLAHIQTLRKNYEEAEKDLFGIYEQLKQTGEYVHLLACLNYISQNYAGSGDYKNALKYEQEFKNISDSLSSTRNRKYAADLEVKYETARKNSRIRQQEQAIHHKSILNYLLTFASLMLLLVFLLSLHNHRNQRILQQQRIRELEMEKQLAATEAVLEGEEKERSRLAKDLHDGLGGMLSGIKYSLNSIKGNFVLNAENAQTLGRSIDMIDSSIDEIRRVAHNMMPENLVKFGIDTALKDFCKDISKSGMLQVNYRSLGLEQATLPDIPALTIYRIVQELVTNAVKHAAAGSVLVQLSCVNNHYSITVEDDGAGFEPGILQQTKGIGWNNIRNRVGFLKGRIDIQSARGKGTSVLIEFEYADWFHDSNSIKTEVP
ncbi:MAG: histidine kinase, partial [Flavihumibacter sp.]